MTLAPKSFDAIVPASQARSRAQEIVDDARREVEAFTYGPEGRRALGQILRRTQAELDVRLRAIPNGSWTAASLESTMALVRGSLAGLDPRLRDLVTRNHARAAELGQRSTVDLLTLFEKRAVAIRPLAPTEALAMGPLAIERHAAALDRYRKYMTNAIRGELQAGLVRGASAEEMKAMLVGPRGVAPTASGPRGVFLERAGSAERIVRTEGTAALAHGANAEAFAQKPHFPGLKRKLIETFDKHTAADSYVAHGQVRDFDETFFDGKHHYLTPPGRPNDRACLVPWRDEWNETTATRERTEAERAAGASVAVAPAQASSNVTPKPGAPAGPGSMGTQPPSPPGGAGGGSGGGRPRPPPPWLMPTGIKRPGGSIVNSSKEKIDEATMAVLEFLASEGNHVETEQRTKIGSPDAHLNGNPQRVEVKRINAPTASSNTINNRIYDGTAQFESHGQAVLVILVNQTSLTEAEADAGVARAMRYSKGRVDHVRIVGKDFDKTYSDWP